MADKVTLATLIRGKSYKQFYDGEYVEFKRGIPREVSDELADDLEQLVDKVSTDDEDIVEMDRFKVERDQRPLEVQTEGLMRKRLRIVAEDVPQRPVRKAPTLKAPPTGFRKRTPAKAA